MKNRLADVSLLAALLLAGCSNDQLRVSPTSGSAGVSGAVYGGQQPISGASIQLYVAGAGGDGSAATPLLTASVTTDNSGSFNLTGLYTCPTAATEVYLVAIGGNPGLMNGGTNAQIALMTALGPCGNLTATTSVEINEVTTVAATYALAPYMQSYSAIGSNLGDAQMMAGAFTMAAELANTGTGSTPGVGVPTGQVVPSQKLNTLASIVAACINSDGGKAGDSSSCGQLFSLASAASSDAPTDAVGALLDIAQNPTSNVVPIFDLDPSTQPFQPSLSSAPTDWTLAITSTTPSPVFSPSPGSYAVSPSVTLSDSNLSAAIYYTTDGSQPTSSSIPYTGAIALSGTTTIWAVAIAGGISSLLTAGTYALAAPTISLTPASVTLSSSQAKAFTATVSGSSNTAVTWALSPAVGSISTAGLYTAPASIAGPQTVTVSATSVADSSVAAGATVSLAPPPISVALTPGSVTLAPAQTQAFTAAVTGTSNNTVTWSLSPAVGSVSAAGLYTAPTTVPYPNTVTITATSVADPTKSASAGVTIVPVVGTTYYLAPAAAGGNDSNNGLSLGAPWLSPNHSVNCGDVIIAAAGQYPGYSFTYSKWGTVTCTEGNNVAWLKCAIFDGCKITATGNSVMGMAISKSYWGAQGFEATATQDTNACFFAYPLSGNASIHHIIFANNICNGAYAGGVGSSNNGSAGVDYLVIVGNIVYNAAQGSVNCNSGISIYQPVQSDSKTGTHIYLAGNFSWDNVDGNPCGGTSSTDGEGLFFDTFSGNSYNQQAVIDNNISIFNGGRGIQSYLNTSATIYFRHNTVFGNNTQTGQNYVGDCGEIEINASAASTIFLNLAQTNSRAGCDSNPVYAYMVIKGGSSDLIYQNYGYDFSGNSSGSANSTGFSYGPDNAFGSNPGFASPVLPGAPNCAGYSSVPACMATVIANFMPTNAAAVGYGYQLPSSPKAYDPLFPQWLCNVSLPSGLVTVECQPGP